MKKMILAALAVGAVALASVPSSAGNASAQYVSIPVFRVSNSGVPVGLGGYAFTVPRAPTSIDVDDVNGTGIGITVCQENTSDEVAGDLGNICGDGGDDVSISYCNTGNPRSVTGNGFKPNSSFTVFVPTTDADQPNCAQPGTTGTITVAY